MIADPVPPVIIGTANSPEGPHPVEATPIVIMKAPPIPAPIHEARNAFGQKVTHRRICDHVPGIVRNV